MFDGSVLTETTFGGHPVSLEDYEGVTVVSCKGVIGTLDQLDYWLHNHKRTSTETFYFGVGEKRSEIVLQPDNMVKIACLQEDYFSFKLKLNKFIHGVHRASSRK